jgi:uncharacterized membrane protein
MFELDTFLYWLFLFFIFNVMGWVLESVIESINHKRLINRGSLAGPYIPIYGIGGILFALVGIPLKSAFPNVFLNIFLVFFVGMSLATLLEYMVGSFLERAFKKQYWDYSSLKLTNKFTYKNRISLVSSIFFGLCALFQAYFLYDVVSDFTNSLHEYTIIIANIVMTLLIGTDALIQIKRQERVRAFLEKLSYEQLRETLLKKLLKTGRTQQIREFRDAVYKNIKDNVETIKENAKENVDNIKENVKKNINKLRDTETEETEEQNLE